MLEGTIRAFKTEGGYGFIHTSSGEDYFFHFSEFEGHIDDIKPGLNVSFQTGPGRKGPVAKNIQLINGGGR